MRVATGAINHESNTFSPVATTWQSYRNERFGYLQGEQLIAKFSGTTTSIGGVIRAAEIHGFELIPTIWANAHPSAPTPRAIFDEILDDMLVDVKSHKAAGYNGHGFALDSVRLHPPASDKKNEKEEKTIYGQPSAKIKATCVASS